MIQRHIYCILGAPSCLSGVATVAASANSLPLKREGMFVTLPRHLCPSFCVVPFYCLHNVKTVLRVRDLQARVSGDSELGVKRKLWMHLHIFGLLEMFSISLRWRKN
jgi:hypothetical protein